MSNEIPAPEFDHFERVVIKDDDARCKGFHGEQGTIIWLDSSAVLRNPALPDKWHYVVHLPTHAACRSFCQSDLKSAGDFDPESAYRGQRPEISFDLVLEEDNDWMEGSYRLPGEFWKVVIFQKDDVPELQFQPGHWKRSTQWERDITGIVIRFPRKAKMSREDLLHAMSKVFGYNDWVQVEGPDSMMLR